MYAKTGYGPGNIAALASGAALSYGPTIGSNDPGSAMSVGGSSGAYAIPAVSGMGGCGCGSVRGHAPVPMRGLGGLFGLGVCDAGCQSWVKWGILGAALLFGVSYLHDKYKY